jgi:hypothetical protein
VEQGDRNGLCTGLPGANQNQRDRYIEAVTQVWNQTPLCQVSLDGRRGGHSEAENQDNTQTV